MLIKVWKTLSLLPCNVGGTKDLSCNSQLLCQWSGLPPGVSGKVRSRGNISVTTQLVPVLHQLLDQAAQPLNLAL